MPSRHGSASHIVGVDLMRLLAFVAVVLIHAVSKGINDRPATADTIALLCRFAVPFFFLAFGYFLRAKAPAATAVRLIRRLAPPFLFWALVYILYFRGSLAVLASPAMVVRLLITGLDGQHLWFLPALGAAGILFVMLQSRFGWGVTWTVAIILYALALAFGPLRHLLGLWQPPFNTRNGPFFGLLFVAAGAWLHTRAIAVTFPMALALFVGAGLLQLAEVAGLVALGTIEFPRYTDDTLMTIPFGIAAFVLALSIPRLVRLPRLLAHLAELSLGLYVVHLLFLDLWSRLFGIDTLAACMINAALAIVSSAICVLILDRLPVVRRLIR